MKILVSSVLAVLFSSVLVLSQETTPTTTPTTAPTTAPTTVPTTVPTTTPTTVPTTTPTTVPTTTPTTVPTTTLTPTTTSQDPSTTVAPSTSETPATTKAPEPTAPTPDKCSWHVNQDNVTCIIAELKALFTIHAEGKTEYIALTQNASSTQSNCKLSNDTQSLVLSELNSYTLTMIFAKKDNKVFVNETIFEYSLPSGNGSYSTDVKEFTVKVGNSYLCQSSFNLNVGNVTMNLSNVHIQAFGQKNDTTFGSAEECDADDKVSDAVPIAVGCALAALIIIVLIAYLVGRRQSRQRGYQSV